KEIIDNELILFPIALLSVFNCQIKKNKVKSYHILHIASAIVLMIMIIIIDENQKHYESVYGEKNIKKVKSQATIFIFEAVEQNMKTMENSSNEINSDAAKIQKKIKTLLHEKLLNIT